MQQYFGIWSDFGFLLFGVSALVLTVGSVWLRAKRLSTGERIHVDHAALERLARIEQIVQASAIEIERVAERQQNTPKGLTEA